LTAIEKQSASAFAWPQSADGAPRRLVILGATGSIGRSTADVIAAAPDHFVVEAVVGGSDPVGLAAMARRLRAGRAVIASEAAFPALREALAGTGIRVQAGQSAMDEAAALPSDMVVGAIAGTAGVRPTHAAIEAGRTVALANKECLVCAGAPFMQAAARNGARLLPLDSEHNAIFQAMGGHFDDVESGAIETITLTASGGPFRNWSREAIAAATPEQALAHPNWDMGPKVTVDSAGLMNKGLEMIEAHHLFAIEAVRLDVLVHPQSIVHGLVSYRDGSLVAGLSHPDMRVHIAHCLAWPHRMEFPARRLNLAEVGQLTFEKPDLERFPALAAALEALAEGGAMPTVLNAANEVAVEAFLQRRIEFTGIARLVRTICNQAAARNLTGAPRSVDEALAVHHDATEMSRTVLANGLRSA
jgi:1-deoxy-D-xylulose-5-phosphate reductoisomerase